MTVKSIELNNFAGYDSVSVSFSENITYLIGNNGAGKSTLGITAIWFMMQGIAEKASGGNTPLIGERFRFIGPKAASAKGKMVLHDEKKNIDITVYRKLTKSGSELSFEAPEGMILDQQWLTDLFNIFLIAPKRFTELTPKEQAKAIGIDTKPIDEDLAALKQEYTLINRDIKGFGNLVEPEIAERVELIELQAQKEAIKTKLNNLYLQNKESNDTIRKAFELQKKEVDREVNEHNENMAKLTKSHTAAADALSILKREGYAGGEVDKFIKELGLTIQPQKFAIDLYPEDPKYIQEMPDDAELKAIDQKILDAGTINQKALLHEQYLENKKKLEAKQKELDDNKKKQDAKEAERLEYIKGFKLPFSNLSIGEDGELLLQGKPIKDPYFSTGELLKIIPILIASRNPELKYVFLQDFNLLDDEKQAEIEKHLTDKGFQLVVEMVGKEKLEDKNCILLKDNVVVDNYEKGVQGNLL